LPTLFIVVAKNNQKAKGHLLALDQSTKGTLEAQSAHSNRPNSIYRTSQDGKGRGDRTWSRDAFWLLCSRTL